jgi:molybdopterin molybdotransferase
VTTGAIGDRLLTVEEARAAVLAAIAGPTEPEIAYLSEARGRILAEDVMSLTALPPWDNSAMDGYAIRAADVATASDAAPVRLEVVGEVRAGSAPDRDVARGTAIRIATGAPIPPLADAVVQVWVL